MDQTFSRRSQLKRLLKDYPTDRVDICGVILDYIGETGATLDEIFALNRRLYVDLFEGNKSSGGRQLLRCLSITENKAAELYSKCEKDYPKVRELLDEVSTVPSTTQLLQHPRDQLGRTIDAVIWQISDIHFGKFNKLEPRPRELAYLLAKPAAEYPNLVPDVMIISGDVASTGDPAELRDFCTFCRELSLALWKEKRPERILVVPGNHDTSWLRDGTSDRLASFTKHVADTGCCITPFGNPNEEFAEGRVLVRRHLSHSDATPPIATVTYPEHKLEFVLLVSAFYSGEVPSKIRKLLTADGDLAQQLLDLLRIDEGSISREYLFEIANLFRNDRNSRIGVIHHNPVQYGVETCLNRFAPQLLETLFKKSIPVLLHGHVHLTEDPGGERPVVGRQAYPLPCPTLSSIPTAGSGRGFNVFLVGPPGTSREIKMFVWTLSQSTAFNPDGAAWRLSLWIQEGQTVVRHQVRNPASLAPILEPAD